MELYDISQIPQKMVHMKRWSEVGMIDYVRQGEKDQETTKKDEETRRKAEESGFGLLGDSNHSSKKSLLSSQPNVRTTSSLKTEKQKINVEEMLEVDGDGMPYEVTGITTIPRLEGDYFVVSDNGGCVTIFDNDGERISMLGTKVRWPNEKFKNTTPYTLESVLNCLFPYLLLLLF
jgi:hypothetical protein